MDDALSRGMLLTSVLPLTTIVVIPTVSLHEMVLLSTSSTLPLHQQEKFGLEGGSGQCKVDLRESKDQKRPCCAGVVLPLAASCGRACVLETVASSSFLEKRMQHHCRRYILSVEIS